VQHVSILANRERLGHCEFGKGVLLSLSPRQQAFRRAILYFAVWMTYVAGGFTGTLAELRRGLLCLLAPVLALIGVAARDLVHPIAPPKPPRDKPEWKV
jgi:uncharacterized membrane protein YoaK (UPF0700 family)